MKKVLGTLALVGIFSAGVSYAGNITVANSNLELSGGLYAGFVSTDNDVVEEKDNFHVTTADLKLINKVNGTVGFIIDMGRTYQKSLISDRLSDEQRTFDIEIAYVTLKALENIEIDAGKLATNVGYELYHPNENGNILFGMLWNGQPVTYNGVRATFQASESLSLYAEYLQEDRDTKTKDGFAVGIMGEINLGKFAPKISYALSYFDYASDKNIVDLVLSTTIGSVDFGLNFDYQYLDDARKEALKSGGATNIEDSAYGVAVYVTPHFTESIYVPIRFEYINDKDSTDNKGDVKDYGGIYGVGGDSAYSISVTPTWKPSKHSFVRAEFDYVKTDKVSADIFGENEDSRTVYAIEAGYSF